MRRIALLLLLTLAACESERPACAWDMAFANYRPEHVSGADD
jgi:hypothetical protein